MEWSTINPLKTDGLNVRDHAQARILNRQIYDLKQYRAAAVGGIKPPFGAGPGTAIDEALRRELILRHDIERFNAARKQSDPANATALEAVRALLTERGTHTHG